MTKDAPPRLFDPDIRRAKRMRASSGERIAEHFLIELIAEELAERLAFVKRDFTAVALMGPIADRAEQFNLPDGAAITRLIFSEAERRAPDDIVLSEERLIETLAQGGDLTAAKARFDLVIAAPAFDAVDDLPGALAQIRLALKPDGLFLGAMFAGGSLTTLRRVMQAADAGRGIARLHPQVDLRALGDLLARAGFAMPVVDEQALDLSYGDPMKALHDLRALGQGNALAEQHPISGKGAFMRILEAWNAMADERGRVAERLVIAHMSGWSPSPDQPKPARRGSGTASLASALKDRSDKA